MELGLGNRTALVTGSHRGTGQIIAKHLLAEGCRVLVHGFTEEQATAAVATLGAGSPVHFDPTSAAVAADLAQLTAAYTIDILINNYGNADQGRWQQLETADWYRAYEHNALASVRLIDALLPGMRERGWGRIINLGTVGSTRPNVARPHYYAAKGALANLTQSLAQAVAGSGVTVNLVSPGLIRTPEVEAASIARAERRGEPTEWAAVEAELAKDIPLGRISTREDIADAVLFLASARAGGIHGLNLRLDGGQLGLVQ
ncbi:MAG: SDR family oxidoreductase [Pseudomonadota bacterium]